MEQLTFADLEEIQSEYGYSNNKISSFSLQNPAILEDFPFDKIYEVSRKEASRKKPIFFIHKYFARRTTCNFRLALLSLLFDKGTDVWSKFYDSNQLSTEDNLTILDPFMGGGTTIFEALRLGANVIGNDLRPLSKFVTEAEIRPLDPKRLKKQLSELENKVGKRIQSYFKTDCPECGKEADVMYNFHVKQAKTTSNCKVHDLYSSFIIASKKGTYTLCCPKCNKLFKDDFQNGKAICPRCDFKIDSPNQGFIDRGRFECPDCGDDFMLRDLDNSTEYPKRTKIIAQEYYCSHCKSHDYKEFTEKDLEIHKKALKDFQELENELIIPKQCIPKGYNTNQMINHGYKYFRDLFTEKQLLCLGLLLKEIDLLEDEDSKFWFLLAFSASLEMNNTFCRYQHNAYKISNIFFNHAYVPISMPIENNIWGTKLGTGTFLKAVNKIIKGKEFNNNIYDISVTNDKSGKIFSNDKVNAIPVSNFKDLHINQPLITNVDSRKLEHIPNKSVDIILTDPPYGSNVMYSELIDFFHVWISSTEFGKKIGFNAPTSPKVEEVIVNNVQNKSFEDYSEGLTTIFKEGNRTLKDNGYLVFTFHDNSLDGWIAVIKSLVEAEFKLVAAYPVHSESRTGAHTSAKNSIAYDIFLICKKREEISKESISIEDMESKSIDVTNSYVKRLNDINAEITIRDIENIFISQFFVNCFNNADSWERIDEIINKIKGVLKQLDEIFTDYNIVEKRSGWWSQTQGKVFLQSLLNAK
nr:DNA methyltransferase [Bacillus subtilis]WGD71456.1 DNA methyltransferase [Bacillus subtilis]WGD75918.1 DNA methyltransferase [Bacillus subtilis]